MIILKRYSLHKIWDIEYKKYGSYTEFMTGMGLKSYTCDDHHGSKLVFVDGRYETLFAMRFSQHISQIRSGELLK